VTIESLIAEAEAARAKAMSEKGGAAAAVSALTAKAKRIKHRVPKQRNPLLAGVFHSPRVAQRTTAAGSGGWSTSGTPEAFTCPTELKPTRYSWAPRPMLEIDLLLREAVCEPRPFCSFI